MSWPSNAARTKNWGSEILTDADLEGQFDLLCQYFIDSLHGTTGHGHTGGTNDGPKITLTTGVQGTLPLANGGTGVTTLAALLALTYPVGSLYFNDAVSTNPATLLGFGTWTAITDRIIIGVGSTYTPAQATGGAATVTISQANLPSYNLSPSISQMGTTGGGSTSIFASGSGNGATLTIPSGGSGTALNVMNPYYAAYIWRRSA